MKGWKSDYSCPLWASAQSRAEWAEKDREAYEAVHLRATGKEWPLAVVLSLTTGKFLCDSFGDLHALAEHVDGGPIWTHEFAHKPTWDRLAAAVFQQHPQLRSFDASDVHDKASAEMAVMRGVQSFGTSLVIGSPNLPLRDKHPLEVLAEVSPGKPVIVIDVGGAAGGAT